jgi:hypothetical protein
MRVVVAKLLATVANAVFVAQHLLKLGSHLTTALARLQVYNLTRKRKCRWRARMYPERES